MMSIVENFRVIRRLETYQNHCKQFSSLDEVSTLPIHLVLHGHVILHLHGLFTSVLDNLSQSI